MNLKLNYDMKRFQRPFFWPTSFIAMTLCFSLINCSPLGNKTPEAQDDCGYVQNGYRERVSWKGNLPVRLYVDSKMPKEYYPAIESAAQTWSTSIGQKAFDIVYAQGNLPPVPGKDGISGIYFLNSWESGQDSEQGRTSLYWIGDLIKEADIRINGKDFRYFTEGATTSDASAVSIHALFLHEMGHVLGLKHKDSGQSVMATYLPAQLDRVALAKTDLESLKCEY